MPGLKNICVYNGNTYEFPLSKIANRKIVESKLSGQTVLHVELLYETQNRKPYSIIRIHFSKITFDNNGIHDMNGDLLSEDFQVESEYRNREIYEALSKRQGQELNPLPIPKAPIIPTSEEIDTLKDYLYRKYPLLLQNSPYEIEETIQDVQERHKDKIRQMKKSYLTK